MSRAALLLLCLLPWTAGAAPRLDLDVRLDPGTRQFEASAKISDDRDLSGFSLGSDFEITTLSVNGKPVAPPAASRRDGWRGLPAGSRRVAIAYRARLKPLTELDHRQVLNARAAVASPEGSFLPASSGWYPDVGRNFSYRLGLGLPTGQKGLVPGDLVEESDGAGGYRAEYAFPHPADGIDLMAGPYAVEERSLTLPSQRTIRIRTWFHPELAGLSQGYLVDSARYIERYSRLIGDYPFALFSVVSSPTPTGFGMPSLTYLGRDVLRLPFIRATSLGHEVLHNWWGNGVYPDWTKGNWSEGLTTFLADYAYKEDEGEDAAREARLGWIRDLAAVPESEDTALRDFVSRHHGISSIVGYGKSAMVFLMLRDLIGRPAFEDGLRLLWRRKQFQNAAWSDLKAAFSEAAGRPLADFFRQWVDRPGAPDLRLEAAEQTGGRLKLRITQSGRHGLRVPLRLIFSDRTETRWAQISGLITPVALDVPGPVLGVELDPDYRIWRRVDPALLPAILREVFVAPRVALVLTDQEDEVRAAAQALSGRLLDVPAEPASARASGLPGTGASLVMGLGPTLDAWLARQGLPPRPPTAKGRGSAQVWADRDGSGRPYVVVSARDAASLKALERGLPHYGKQSWLVFEGARAAEKGVWPPRPERLPVSARAPGAQ
jgi:aminopeptidase N